MKTQSDYQALAQTEVDALAPLFAQIEKRIESLVSYAEEFNEKVFAGEIEGEITVKPNKVERITKRFQGRVKIAHAVGGKACEAAELNEGK